MIDRHDILRTAVVWEGTAEPVQVVWREAPLLVEEVELGPRGGRHADEQLRARFDPRRYRMDIRQAPLMRVMIAEDLPKPVAAVVAESPPGRPHERWRC